MRRNNKKGFTLIELLAVIVILAMIALIATPLVMGVINRSRMNSVKDNAYGVIKAAENYLAKSNVSGTPVLNDELFSFPADTRLEVKGTKPQNGYVIIDKDGKTMLSFSQSGYCVSKEKDQKEVGMKKGACAALKAEAPTYDKYREIIPFSAFQFTGGAKIEDGKAKIVSSSSGIAVTIYNYGTKWQVDATFQAYGGVSSNCSTGNCIYMSTSYFDENNQSLITNNGYSGNGFADTASATTPKTFTFTGYNGFSDRMHHLVYRIAASSAYALPPYDVHQVVFTLDKPVSRTVPGGKEVILKSGKSSAFIKTVEYSTNQSTWTKVAHTLSGSSFKVVVPKDGDYYFRVTNQTGQVSSASSLIKVRTNDQGITKP